MKIGFYDDFRPCIVKNDGVVDISRTVRPFNCGSPQLLLESIMANFDLLRPKLQAATDGGKAVPVSKVRLRAPVPKPTKILNGFANYKEGVTDAKPRPMEMFFKAPSAIIGPDDAIILPPYWARIFHHEAELCVVIGRRASNVPASRALEYVFGYMCGVDVSGRGFGAGGGPGPADLPGPIGDGPPPGVALTIPGRFGKSFDTFNPVGPYIVTADEIADPHRLQVRYRVNGQLRQDYNTSDMEYQIPKLIEGASAIMTLEPGDLIMCGTNHQGLGPLQDGDTGEIEISGIGRFSNPVVDPLKRKWPQGIERAVADFVRKQREAARV